MRIGFIDLLIRFKLFCVHICLMATMAIYNLKRTQLIKADIDKVWDFFTNPDNLATITPDNMGFRVTSEYIKDEVYPGQIITYKVAPLLNIPMFWMTEITTVVPKQIFVDEQRRGPYKLWHHQHHFEKVENGILMTDIVHYQLPLLFLGTIARSLFVKRILNNIFDHRHNKIEEIFN